MAVPRAGEVSVEIAASPKHVYALISDVTRMGEWSPECRQCEWIDDTTFRGHNRRGPIKWSTTAKVTAAVPGREFSFVVVFGDRDSTHWHYRMEPNGDGGTRLTESYEVVWVQWYFRVIDPMIMRDRQLRTGMRKTLERIKAVAERA